MNVRFPAVAGGTWTLHDEDGEVLCTLPCTHAIKLDKRYALQLNRGEELVEIPPPGAFPEPGQQVELELTPPRGSRALGITLTAVGGTAMLGGAVLFVAGAKDESFGPIPGFLVSFLGTAGVAGGIVYTVYSRSTYKPTYRTTTIQRARWEPQFVIGPGLVAGGFSF